MTLNELDQSLLGTQSLASLDETNLGSTDLQAELDQPTDNVEGNNPANVTTNFFVQSLNQTTEQTTVRPKGMSANNPALRQLDGVPNYKSTDDFYANAERNLRRNPLYESGYGTPKYTPTKQVEKYDDQDYGYLYGMDNDDVYGKLESGWMTAGKAIPRLIMGTVTKLSQGAGFVSGLLYGVGAKIVGAYEGENVIDIAADNAIMNSLNAVDEWTKNEWLPTFQEAADREKGFWARASSDADFWTDDFVDGVSFLAAAWIPGAILGEIGAGAAMASRLARGARALGIAGDVGATVEEAGALTNWFAQTGKAARQLDAFNSWAIATSSEAMFEAAEVRKSILESPDYDINGNPIINPLTGRPFTTAEKKKMAGQGALNTFVMNAAVLGVSNVFEYKYLSKLMGKAAPSTGMSGLIGGAGTLGEEAVVTQAATPLWKTFAKETALGTVREGFAEENMQLAIQRYNTEYGQQGRIGGIFDADTWINTLKQAGKQTVDAIYGKDKEAAISIGMGGLIGSIFGGATSQYQNKKEQSAAQALMTAFNESQNSWLKFGNVFKYETVDAVDKEGNPIKTKKIVLDGNGNPVYDYDKLAVVSGGMRSNLDMFERAFDEVNKYNQNLLRTRAWADFVGAHINAGLEKTLMAKLDKLETADPVALAKLGFVKDENFPAELQKYRTIANEIIKQNKALTDNVLFRNTSFFDKKNVVDNNRRAHLVEIVGNNVVNKAMANEVSTDLQNLKSQLISDEQTHLTDGIVEQLNNSLYRIKSQEELIEKMKKSGSDKILPMEVYERVLANLKAEHAELLKDNETQLKEITQNTDGSYRYKKVGRNDSSITSQLDAKSRNLSELKNEILNDAQMFSFFADASKGRENYEKFFIALTAEKQKQAQERVEQERQKKAADEARAKERAETEHRVVKEMDGTFTILNPDGVIIEQGVLNENEANQKAAQFTAELVAKKAAEQKAKEEEEKKKQQQQKKSTTPTPSMTIDEKKELVNQKQDLGRQLDEKGRLDSASRIKQLIDEGKTPDEAADIAFNEWLTTTDGKQYSKIISEIEALEKEIADEEAGTTIPTLEEFLRDKFEKLKTNPDFKIDSYEDWFNSGAANSYIRDYNRQYSKKEKLVPIPGSPTTSTATTDEEAIGNLDIKDATVKTLQATLRAVRKVYERVAGDAGLLQKLINKINEVKDDFVKNALLQSINNKATSSTYVPLSSVGIDIPVQEHLTYDRINMPMQEFMLGFTLLGDSDILNILSGTTGDITDRVVAMASVEYIRRSQQRLQDANIPGRTLITSETPKDIAKLNKGIPVIAKAHRSDGFNLQLFLKDQNIPGNVYVGGIGNYAIVYPDNTTEKVEWTEEQREFVKNNMLIDGEKMTDAQYDAMQEMYNKMQAFEAQVMPILEEFLRISPNEESMDITAMFKDTFTLSGKFSARKGESLQDVIQRAGSDTLFKVQVADENDVVTEKFVPLLANLSRGVWTFNFPLNPNERLVTTNEENEVTDVLSMDDYLREEHNLNLKMTDKFPGGRAWIAKSINREEGYVPYKLTVEKVQSPATFKDFATAFKELKEAIEKGIAEDKSVFKYRGQTYNSIDAMMMAFNMDHYGFYKYNGFVANLGYNPKAKVNGKTVGRFLFEIRPARKKDKQALESDQKRALNMYISDEAMLDITDATTDAEITDAYTQWVKGLVKDFNKLVKKLEKSVDTVLNKMVDRTQEGNFIDSHLLFEYDLVNNTQKFKLKLVDKTTSAEGTAFQVYPFLKFDATGIGVNENEKNTDKYNLRLTFNDVVPTITQATKPAPPVQTPVQQAASVPSETGSTAPRIIEDEINPDDNDSPFMLDESEESYEKYTESSFNAEVEWLKKALAGSGIKLEDLGTIINNLAAKKQVLGYYKNKAIYVSEALSKKGTIYHEAFHALFRDVMTAKQRSFYIDKMKARVGYITNDQVEQFRNDRGYFNKTNEEIRDLMYEENLADGFRKWKLEQKQPKESWFRKFISIFDRIINFFKSKKTEIEGLYEDFDAGRYAGINREASTISQEGVYSITYGRPRLFVKEGATNFTKDNTQILNIDLQNELVYKLTNMVSGMSQGTFTEKFNTAVQELKKDYNIEDLIKNSADPDNYADAIRARYGQQFYDALYILGESVPYVLAEDLQGAADAEGYRTTPGANKDSLDIIKKAVEGKIDSLGLEKGFDVDNLEIPEDDEDRAEKEKGGEFDTIHMNPLQGLSREFRSLFSTIPYEYVDEQLGVTIKKMADGNMLYNAMIKIAANTPLDQILPSLAKAVSMMKEDNDRTSVQLEAFQNFIQKQFGIADLSDPEARPSKNIYLYKQFIDTFFVTELASRQVVLKTTPQGSTAEVFDASIFADMNLKKEQVKYHYEQAYRRMSTEEEKKQFEKNFEALQRFILSDLLSNLKIPAIVNARSKSLNDLVNKTKRLLDDVNIILPKNLIRQSFLAIYNIENELEFSPQSKQNRLDMEADQRLMKEGAYLESDFFLKLATISRENIPNIFADTKESFVDLGDDYSRVRAINAILKKSMKYVIKYDVNSAIPVFQNAENKKIWRYSRYTPPILLAQMVREYGIEAITDMYPVLRDWFENNPLFDGSPENDLFLENLQMSAFGGFRQELDDDSKVGSTFGSIDSKALLISNIVHFMNRETITKKMKGVKEPVSIVTYNRSRTQEEATTTNFLMTAKYQKLVTKEGRVNSDMINTLEQMLKQEYNRISREWANRENDQVVRYNGYNNNIHPETGLPILGDSYTTLAGKTVMLRAYQFKNLEHFFDQQKSEDRQNNRVRTEIKEALLDLAKQGVSFEEALEKATATSGPVNIKDLLVGSQNTRGQFEEYMDETFQVYLDALKTNNVITEEKDKPLKSELIPSTINLDFADPKAIQDYGYENLEQLLKDHHLNVFMSKMLVNQIFDGDIATGIKSAVEYYKRNKAGVISGNSMKFGFFRTAVIQNLQADINSEDLLDFAKGVTSETPSDNRVDIADGQSWHTMNHRIRMMDAWGRVDSEVRQLLNAAKYRKLEKEEIEFLENRKVVLNSIKTATGGVFEYYKLSEHLISRTEVSHLVMQPGQNEDQAYQALDDLYSQIETLEDLIVADPNREDAKDVESQIRDLYAEVHKYWQPKRSRAKLHYALNSMEMSGIDQLFDTNASKKTTIVPIRLNETDITDLSASKSATSGLFKFMQVETSGVKDKITLPTQARQLLTTYLTALDTKAYNGKSIKQLAAEYSATLGQIADVNTKALDRRILDKDGNVNVTELYEMMYEGLKKQGADANTLKFFEIKNGEPVFNPNMPVIKKIFTYYYFSMFNDAIFSEKVSGRSDILVSSYGHEVLYDTETGEIITGKMQDENPEMYKSERYQTRPLGVDVEVINGQKVYTIEVIIPEPLAENESERQLYLEKLNKFFSTRIPTEDKRSMVVAKVVDYMDASYRNSIVVPQLVHILAGSDLDVDKLYSHIFAHYIDYNGQAHVYGDYENFATDSQGRFVEYINYMLKDNPAIKDSLDAEIKNVTEKPVFTSDFIKLKDELGLSDMGYTADELKEKRKDLAVIVDALATQAKELQTTQNVLFDNHLKINARRGSKAEVEWRQARQQYRQAKQLLDEKKEELRAVKAEQKLLDNTIKLAALVNVLKSMGMPTTQTALTKYINENGNPVVTVLQNESLQQKMDILSNEKVFNDFYIKEVSDTKIFSQIAKDIGASVEDVVKQNSIHSIMGDVVANNLNSSNKDGIGIAASFNKFLAFAEKNGLTLQFDLFGSSTAEGLRLHNDFLNSDGIRNIGKSLGMFADAAKDPIPSVLNLNPETSSVSNVLIAMSGNVQMGVLINKIPFIEEITNEVINSQSAAQTNKSRFENRTTTTLLKQRIIKPGIEDLADQKRLGEIFEKDKKGEIVYGKMLPMFIETKKPVDIVQIKETGLKPSLDELGFIVRYEDGGVVAEDVAEIYLAEVYKSASLINSDIIKLGRILNLIKDQKPDFNQLDLMLADFEYFMSGESVFGESIVKVLASSNEYMPLVKAAKKMSDYSKQLLIERTPLFKSINSILQRSFSNAKDPKSKQNISDQITKLIIIQKTKVELQRELKNLEGKTDDISNKKREFYEKTLKYFTADYWINNNTFLDDLDYLYANNPGNSFVQFLKVNVHGNMNFLEGSTRIKLDKDIAENINNGFEALEKSADRRTRLFARQMFYYLVVKDGLGFANNSFLSYLNPSMTSYSNPKVSQFQEVSTYLDDFQELLAEQQKFIDQQSSEIQKIVRSGIKEEDKRAKIKDIADKVYKNYLSLFDKFFNTDASGKTDWINLIVRKIFSNVNNQKYIRDYIGGDIKQTDTKNYVNDLINAGVFSNITPGKKVGGKRFDFSYEAGSNFTVDFTSISEKPVDPQFELLFGNIFLPFVDSELKLRALDFPMLIKNSEGRLFKLMAIDDKSISEDIAFQSITGIYKGTFGLKAEYREIEVEGAKSILNFGFTQPDAVALNEHSKIRNQFSEENDLLAFGVDPSEISDNKSTASVKRQVNNPEVAARIAAEAEERRRAKQAQQEGQFVEELPEKMRLEAEARKKAKAEKGAQQSKTQFVEELPEKMRLEAEARKKAKEGKPQPTQPTPTVSGKLSEEKLSESLIEAEIVKDDSGDGYLLIDNQGAIIMDAATEEELKPILEKYNRQDEEIRKKIKDQQGPTAPVSRERKGTIQLLPENEEKIKNGTKSITNRTLKQKVDDGIYEMSDGTQIEVRGIGLFNVEYIGDSVIVTAENTGRSFSGDDYAKAEGFKDWADFQQNNNFSQKFVDGLQSRYVYEVKLVEPAAANIPSSTKTRTVEYTPKGEKKQTFTIEGSRVLDEEGKEPFKEGSLDYNKILANLAVKEGRAVVVDYRGIKYVVNNKGQIISGATGKVMQWGERNGDRQAILALANKTKAEATSTPGTVMTDPSAITDADIAKIYKDKVDALKAQNLPVETLESFSARAKKLVDNLKKGNFSKEDILESIQCL